MNIEIANRLVNLRKKNGLSQEELASKLGLSRQAVSKWERAEASPDTDNLICLAKLYGVSLDELLRTDDDVDTIVKEQSKEDSPKPDGKPCAEDSAYADESKAEYVHLGSDGIHIKDGGDEVHISSKGIYIKDSNDDDNDNDEDDESKKSPLRIAQGVVTASLLFVVTAAYVICGCLFPGVWAYGWIGYFLIPLVACIFETAITKRFETFTGVIVFIAVISYLIMGFFFNLWHPGWVVFLAIPFYAIVVSPIDNHIENKSKDDVTIEVNSTESDSSNQN